MFLHKFKESKISIRNKKTLKFQYLAKNFQSILNSKNYVFFFYHTFLTEKDFFLLKQILFQENLKMIKIQKAFSNLCEISFLKTMLRNNMILIFLDKENSNFDLKNFLLKINSIANLFFVGGLLTKKFLRPNEINLFLENNLYKTNQLLYSLIKIQQKKILTTLINLKK
jgi:hypothetical protein